MKDVEIAKGTQTLAEERSCRQVFAFVERIHERVWVIVDEEHEDEYRDRDGDLHAAARVTRRRRGLLRDGTSAPPRRDRAAGRRAEDEQDDDGVVPTFRIRVYRNRANAAGRDGEKRPQKGGCARGQRCTGDGAESHAA